jgi:malonate transporter and related proteins
VIYPLGIYFLGLFLGIFVFRNSLGESALEGAVGAFPSMAYSGLPVLNAIVGPAGIVAVLVENLVRSIFMVPTTLVLLEVSTSSNKTKGNESTAELILVLSAVKQPVVWLPVSGFILALCGPLRSRLELTKKQAVPIHRGTKRAVSGYWIPMTRFFGRLFRKL